MVTSEGHSAEAHGLDVTVDEAVQRAIDDAVHLHGHLDVLHSHAGIQIEGTLEQVTPEGMDASWRMNIRAPCGKDCGDHRRGIRNGARHSSGVRPGRCVRLDL
ncbi:MAG: SDR family NAD(P)-dependent oxidoreductase [Pseudomonadota bacterium]